MKIFSLLQKRISNKVQKTIIEKKSDTEQFRDLGVKIGNNFSSIGTVDFGSEPYLISMGDDVRLSKNIHFVTHDGGMHVIRQYKGIPADLFGTIEIGNNVFVGMNTIILPDVKIGSNVIIGAGSIVTKDIPSNSVACGTPARVIETIDEYYSKNKDRIELTKNMTREEKKSYLLDKYCKG